MSPAESIVFSPDVDERQLDREVEQIDDRLETVGEDVPVSFDQEELNSLSPAGGGGGGGGGAGAGAAAGLASKIPKPVAGVTAAAALPIAIAGGVGVGLLSAMQGASAQLQTSSKLFGIAVDNFFRVPGKVLNNSIVGPIAKKTLNVATDFDDLARNKGLAVAIAAFDDKAASTLSNAITDTLSGKGSLGDIVLTGTATVAAGAVISKLTWGTIGGGAVVNALGWGSVSAAGIVGAISWPFVGAGLIAGVISWGSFQSGDLISAMGWGTVTGAATVAALGFGTVTGGAVIGAIAWPTISAGQVLESIAGGEKDPTEGTFLEGVKDFGKDVGVEGENNPLRSDSTDVTDSSLETGVIDPREVPGLEQSFEFGQDVSGFLDSGQAGGRVASSGLAEIHRNEFIGDRDRLVSELADAIGASNSGSSQPATVDTSALENEVQGLRRQLKRVASEMQSMELRTDNETIGRVASKGKRNGLAGRDPIT